MLVFINFDDILRKLAIFVFFKFQSKLYQFRESGGFWIFKPLILNMIKTTYFIIEIYYRTLIRIEQNTHITTIQNHSLSL